MRNMQALERQGLSTCMDSVDSICICSRKLSSAIIHAVTLAFVLYSVIYEVIGRYWILEDSSFNAILHCMLYVFH
jgi:hypothetical protein